ncbi:hypothetical protein [Diaminobutyricimonas sp. LJ205]|uniref:hypothetical protein n=1 Tax=Diaminobutyricimonas sp. LJ205 TaxID=2683590 RepID=UPI0012F52653|nr:hypothetical protein [Diaminobutyricimonas sp. LJ205]
MNDGKPIDNRQQLLAVCMVPRGVEARDDALDRCLTLLDDIRSAVLAAQGGDKRVLFAVSLVAEGASALVTGVRTLLPDNVYAASALVRQLVEVEYLAWACGYDEAETLDWISSDRDTRRRRWQPRHLRQRAGDRFDADDYSDHCEAGGHPTPVGIMTLNGPTISQPELIGMAGVQSYELVLHTVATCDYLSHAIPEAVSQAKDLRDRAHAIGADWRTNDPAALFTTTGGDADQEATLLVAIAEGIVELTERAAEWRGGELC